MHNRLFRKRAVFALAMLMTLMAFMLTGCGKSYEYIFGDVEWLSSVSSQDSEKKTIKDTFYYSDGWFEDNPSSENKELALASIQLVASCVSDDADNPGEALLKRIQRFRKHGSG